VCYTRETNLGQYISKRKQRVCSYTVCVISQWIYTTAIPQYTVRTGVRDLDLNSSFRISVRFVCVCSVWVVGYTSRNMLPVHVSVFYTQSQYEGLAHEAVVAHLKQYSNTGLEGVRENSEIETKAISHLRFEKGNFQY
jgi:hypothetical protein